MVRFQISKGLGQQRGEASDLPPLRRQGPQRRAHDLAGEISLAMFFQHEQAGIIHDEAQALRAAHPIPTDPRIPVLEVQRTSRPEQNAHRFVVIKAPHDLQEPMSGGLDLPEPMLLLQPLLTKSNVLGSRGTADHQIRRRGGLEQSCGALGRAGGRCGNGWAYHGTQA